MIKPGKLLLSSGLVLASGAYAWWQHATAPLPPLPVPKPVAVQEAKPAPVPVARAAPVATAPPPVAQPPVAQAIVPDALPAPEPAAKPKQEKVAKAEPPPPGTGSLPPPNAPPPPPPPDPLNAVQLGQQPVVSTGRYLDGEFVGNSVDGEWGPVQVKVVVRNGDIANVICIEFPFHRQRSAEISEWAIPQLVEETIKAQGAKIDWISQASFTSDNFQQSLASALVRAKKPS